jgi:D-alanyl-D-alanine carboxypeptidase/D-alanyl-D-alanine-endopeptidase (penicillin-binding protein 4)
MRVAGAVAAMLALLAGLPASAAQTLASRLDAALEVRALRGAGIGALVVGEDGEVLYARSPDRALIPASNQKILTALAALDALGPTHRFTTEVLTDAAPDTQGAVGTLYLRGGGDPALTSEDFWRLAADLRRAGLRAVREGIVVDDSLFDAKRWHPSWGRTGSRAYHAPVGALTVNYGAFAVTVEPNGSVGSSLRAVVDPPIDFLALSNRARTGPPRTRGSLVVDRRALAEREEVQLRGDFPSGRPAKTFHRSVLDPARYAGSVLAAQLDAVGVAVGPGLRRASVPDTAVPLLAFEGPPLSDVVRSFLKYSNNQIGEALVKALGVRAAGAPGSWASGATAVRAVLESLDLPMQGLALVDGSGLSYENRVTPRLLVAALRAARESFRFGPEFEAALPIASADGTLEKRADGAAGRVRAKTGLLTRVTSLAGYAERADGGRLFFAVVTNGFRRSAEEAMDALDGFAAALVEPAGAP